MKKKLALVLAAAMALTSLPTVAFGKSSNSISTVVSAKEDTKLSRTTSVTNPTSASDYSIPNYIPRLELVSDSKIPIKWGSVIRLRLTNAEWLNAKTGETDYWSDRLLEGSEIEVRNNNELLGKFSVDYIDASTIEIKLGTGTAPDGTPVPGNNYNDVDGTAKGSANTTGLTAPTGSGSLTPTAGTHSANTGNFAYIIDNGLSNILFPGSSNDSTFDIGITEDANGISNSDIGSDATTLNGGSGISNGDVLNVEFDNTTRNFNIQTAFDESTGTFTIEPNNRLTTTLQHTDANLFRDLGYDVYEIAWQEAIVEMVSGTSTLTGLVDKSMTITVYPFSTGSTFTTFPNRGVIVGDTVISIPLLAELTSTGDAIVTIESNDSNVTTGPLTFATVSEGNIRAYVSKTVTIPETGKELENIVINEVTPGSLEGEYYVRLKAPSNFYWSATKDAELTFAGFYAGRQGVKINDASTEGLNNSKTNEITISFATKGAGLPKSTTIGTIILSGLILKPTDDAKFGDVNVTVRGAEISSTSVLVGAYKDYVVTMDAEDKDLPVILAGYMPGYADNSDVTNEEEIRALELHIAESVPNSWWGLRKTTLSVPDGVQIRGAEIKFTKGSGYTELVDEHEDKIDITELSTSNKGKFTEGEVTIYKGERLEFKGLKMKDDEKAEAWVKLYVSVEPGFTGDIVATLAGGGIEDDITATIATAVAPVNVSMKQTEIKLGYKNIELNDITITENKAGAIRKEYYGHPTKDSSTTNGIDGGKSKYTAKMILQIGDTTDKEYLKFDSINSYEVTEGDIVLDSVKVRSGNIEIEVKNESDKPSTIVLKGVTGLADRVPPEGYYALSIGGFAVVNNYNEDKPVNGMFETQFFEVPKAYNVITAAPGSANEFNTYVQMKIDDTTMIVGSDTIQMDAAPYISEGRTMLPIRYVANAFGISDDNIHFDQNSKTVTLVTQNRTVQLTVGSRTILSNGTPIEMDVAAEITDGRTFIPVMWVATALGIAQPKWDEATRTVTFNGEYASNDALGSQVQDNSGADAEVVSTDDADKDEE